MRCTVYRYLKSHQLLWEMNEEAKHWKCFVRKCASSKKFMELLSSLFLSEKVTVELRLVKDLAIELKRFEDISVLEASAYEQSDVHIRKSCRGSFERQVDWKEKTVLSMKLHERRQKYKLPRKYGVDLEVWYVDGNNEVSNLEIIYYSRSGSYLDETLVCVAGEEGRENRNENKQAYKTCFKIISRYCLTWRSKDCKARFCTVFKMSPSLYVEVLVPSGYVHSVSESPRGSEKSITDMLQWWRKFHLVVLGGSLGPSKSIQDSFKLFAGDREREACVLDRRSVALDSSE